MKSNRKFRILVLLTIFILLSSVGVLKPINAQSSTTLSVYPASFTALTCTDSIIAVRVENIEDLNAYEIALTFTPGSIEVLEITNGGFLENVSFFLPPYFNNETGSIVVVGTQIARPPKDGSGDLILIRFRALTPGATIQMNIDSENTFLVLPTGPEIPYTSYNGVITTADCPTPQISIFPAGSTACLGQDTTIKVRVTDVYDLYSYGLNLTYDTGAIEILSVTNGGFLTPGLYGPFNWPTAAYNPEGTILFDMSQIMTGTNPPQPKDGTGDLISITFRAHVASAVVNFYINESGSSLTNWPDAFKVPYTATDGVIYTSTCDPNAVELLSFDVVRKKLKAFLSWETANELDVAGFNIYRSGFVDGTLKKINKEFIPAKEAGSLMGAEYTYLDKPLKAWKTYYYWLETVELNGETSLTGPIKAARPKK